MRKSRAMKRHGRVSEKRHSNAIRPQHRAVLEARRTKRRRSCFTHHTSYALHDTQLPIGTIVIWPGGAGSRLAWGPRSIAAPRLLHAPRTKFEPPLLWHILSLKIVRINVIDAGVYPTLFSDQDIF